jgi:hypothetical protein
LIIESGRLSSTETYYVQPVEIEGFGESPGSRFYWLYRPEWLRPGFDPKTLEDNPGAMAVYRRHINSVSQMSALKGLAGSEEGFEELAGRLLGLEEIEPESVASVLSDYFEERSPVVGYVLKQRSEKIEYGDEARWVKTDFYQVSSWFHPTEKELARLRRQAEKSNGRTLFLAGTDVPF